MGCHGSKSPKKLPLVDEVLYSKITTPYLKHLINVNGYGCLKIDHPASKKHQCYSYDMDTMKTFQKRCTIIYEKSIKNENPLDNTVNSLVNIGQTWAVFVIHFSLCVQDKRALNYALTCSLEWNIILANWHEGIIASPKSRSVEPSPIKVQFIKEVIGETKFEDLGFPTTEDLPDPEEIFDSDSNNGSGEEPLLLAEQ